MLDRAEAQAGELSFGLLGDFRIFRRDAPVPLRGRKARGLLAYLAAQPDPVVGRERAADLLWSDRGTEQARNSLRQSLAEIRAAMPDCEDIVVDRDRIRLARAPPRTDIGAILTAAEAGDAGALAERIARAGDTFLADLSGLSPAFDEWLQVERVGQSERLVDAVLAGCGAMISAARPADIQTILRGLDRIDPWNEAVARLGLEADFAAGDMASLHRRYRRLEDVLKREFGVLPSEETRSLFGRLSQSAPAEATPARAPASAPAPSPRLPAAEQTMPPTVLVSPIESVTASAEAAEIAAIVTDDIRTALARHADLRVLALDASSVERMEHFCRNAVSTYLVSGRIRQIGEEMRVNLMIGRADTGVVIWSRQFELDRGDLAGAVDQLVARAVGATAPVIENDLADENGDADGHDTVRAYLAAQRLVGRGRALDSIRQGVDRLEALIVADPHHASARLLLARMYNTDFWQGLAGHDVEAFRTRALLLASEALAIEPGSVRLQLRMAWCHLRARKWLRAEHHFRAALETAPYDADALNEIGFGLCHLGELDEAEPVMQRAFLLNPFAPPDYHADRAVLLMLRGDAAAAEEHFEVSGEEGMQYLAARLANGTALGSAGEKARPALIEAFRAKFVQAWQPERQPTTADVLAWARDTLPFRREEHVRLLETGLAAAIGPTFPA